MNNLNNEIISESVMNIEMVKKGRPRLNDKKKTEKISINFSKEDKERFMQFCSEKGIKSAVGLRMAVLNYIEDNK